MQTKRKSPQGIRARHSRTCPSLDGGSCRCKPSYEAGVFSKRDGRKLRKSFPTQAAARAWRADATVALRKGTMRAATTTTLREAAEAWLDGAKAGTIRTRGGDVYKPSVLRGYSQALTTRLLPGLGGAKLTAIERRDVQDVADRMLADGLDPSTIRNALMPLRAIYRRAISRGDVAVNPTAGVTLPAVRGTRDRIADPAEAAALLAGLAPADRALWATALYAGLRRGELQALKWDDIDLAAGVLRVERSWDAQAGPIEPKSAAARRTVPIASVLRDYLIEHKLATGGAGFVFGPTGSRPFTPSAVRRRAATAWKHTKLTPIGLHEARHTYASLMIAAGGNAKALGTYLGHSSITITLDRYGHLFPGNEEEAAALLDAYLLRCDMVARLAHVGPAAVGG